MTWSTLRHRAQQMGFDLAYRSRMMDGGGYQPEFSSPPSDDGSWFCLGSFEQTAGVWVQPVTDAARAISPRHVSAVISEANIFLAPMDRYDDDFSDDFLAVAAPACLASANPDWGCMPS